VSENLGDPLFRVLLHFYATIFRTLPPLQLSLCASMILAYKSAVTLLPNQNLNLLSAVFISNSDQMKNFYPPSLKSEKLWLVWKLESRGLGRLAKSEAHVKLLSH
jgi:hypothetical protein